MHVLILNQTFHPDVAATAQHMWDLARHLESQGHHVTAVTSRAIYGTNRQFDAACERIGNIEIHRVKQTAFGKVHNLGRMCDFLSFYVSAFVKMQSLPAPDVILALTSPPMIALLGIVQKQWRSATEGRPIALVNHVMDLYPDAAEAMGMLKDGSPLTRLMRRLTKLTFDQCDALIALGHDMRDRIVSRYGPNHRIEIVHPWADKDEVTPQPRLPNPLRDELGLGDVFTVVYSGNLGAAHDVDTLIGAIDRTRDDDSIRWCFTGGGKGMNRLRDWARKHTPSNLTFLAYQPREGLNALLNLADVHLVSQLPAFTGIVVPSKFFGILASGRPSIFVGPYDTEVARILLANDCGLVIPPGDVEGLVNAVQHLRNDARERSRAALNARRALADHYDRAISCEKIHQLLKSVVFGF